MRERAGERASNLTFFFAFALVLALSVSLSLTTFGV